MKPAQQWIEDYEKATSDDYMPMEEITIKRIQRDAWLQGMKDAMKACGKGLARANIAAAMTRLPAAIAPSDPKTP